MSATSHLQLPYLAAGQAQKHVTVNESLRKLDALVQLSVVSATTSAQPGSPTDGQVYILPSGKTGAQWGAMTNLALAYYRDGAWEEITPREGWLAYVQDSDLLLHYSGSAWSLLEAGKALRLSASDRIVGRVSSGAGAAEEVTFTDQAQALCDDTSFQAMCATLGTWRVLAASGVAVSHTGNTTETTLATVTIPAGAVGPNGMLRVTTLWSYPNNANVKNCRIRLGGVAGSYVLNLANTTTATLNDERLIANRNNAASQVIKANNSSTVYGITGGTATLATINTASAQDLLFQAQLSNAGDTVTLETYLVELFNAV